MKLSLYFIAGIIILLILTAISLFIGAGHVNLHELFTNANMQQIFFVSRLPRTLALLLAGSAMSVAGLVMQLLTQNRFVEPTLVGTTQSASLGLLIMMVLAPEQSVMIKMVVASLFAMMGTILFMIISHKIVLKSALMVPLIGIMLGAIISAVTTFFAMYYDLLQSLYGWQSGDFSGILQGRYELLWLVCGLTLVACWSADQFTVVGLGRDFSVNVGLNYRRVMIIGLIVIALIGGIVVVVVGVLPFLGLIVPNIVSLLFGDNVRKTIPWVCLFGGGLVLICDIIGRLIRYPFEIPVSVILGIVGAVIFLILLSRKKHAS
ncbi:MULTISPECIES: ABC transporter permease [unclassified Gilliamella]|uniref:ABC transporter permease n=1 Tax=unclassified Gilliamella TaxID=2685620 RepID=UPI00226A2D7B|nr:MULTISPECIES: iron chelate uptake ABC transporter family permease subunit [unclassified Gilliamella]MCX8575184.1 iron chelate uptake ABC transporter family permease subunit [Gilliamella sp. B3831]MCX8577566.1 iron chelate uptake ABC transporter family permease subunit [Gilliamella sp. B3815]MCX8590247.1 iron chelate uptake ABC transporter family permease subunit [Gilliamella sp. B3812]MCX8604516.1 iron chelate uptake ABC transporter family permease subunit [Gilliamella sp. B3823]MCX8606317.